MKCIILLRFLLKSIHSNGKYLDWELRRAPKRVFSVDMISVTVKVRDSALGLSDFVSFVGGGRIFGWLI